MKKAPWVTKQFVISGICENVNEGFTSLVALTQLGLMTGFPALSADDRRISPGLLPQEWIFLMGCVVLYRRKA